jgi:hypothetical protein
LIVGAHVVGVADGATAKPWDDPRGPDGAALAEALSVVLAGLPADTTAATAVDSATRLVADLLRANGLAPGSGSAVSFCVLHTGRRQVWRVGEARVLVDGEVHPPRTSGESVVAAARALVLRQKLAAGAAVAQLAADDPGREAVQELLRSLVGLRNVPDPRFGYPAVDGRPVPESFIEVIALPESACEVVLATDGYPEPAATLAEAERLLGARLARDPLMIADPPETKGVRPGAHSFDDRAFVRVRLNNVSRKASH